MKYEVSITESVFLYKVVYRSSWAIWCVLILLGSLLLQPIERASAAEIIDIEPDAAADAVSISEPEPPQESVHTTSEPDAQIVDVDEPEDTITDQTQDTDETSEEAPEEASAIHTTPAVTAAAPTTETVRSTSSTPVAAAPKASTTSTTTQPITNVVTPSSDTVATTTEVNTSTASSTQGMGDEDQEVAADDTVDPETLSTDVLIDETSQPDNHTNTVPEIADVTETTVQSTTTATTTAQESGVAVQFSDLNYYQFSKQECVSVGEGGYYCSDEVTNNAPQMEDALYAAVDASGDKEIYLRTKGVLQQLSDNQLEDDAPFYDPKSETVVWHRLVQGRYQIVSYDLTTKQETILTANQQNDMEPARDGVYTVWQRWVENNWEIVLHDGVSETQITDNEQHDIAPSIRGGYVMWNTTRNSEHAVEVYDIATGMHSMIADEAGAQILNPRFVLVYDTKFDNGDIVTKGYDLDSGEVVPLSAVPGQLPTEIPSPETTDETRALIQAKPTNKDDKLASTTAGNTLKTATSTTSFATSTSATAPQDLDLRSETVSTSSVDQFDLVVEPYSAASSTQQIDSATATISVE